MEKYLYRFFIALFAVCTVTACGGSDDDPEEEGERQVLLINGVAWESSIDNPPVYHGKFGGNGSTGLVFTKFTRQETTLMNYFMSDAFELDISMYPHCPITKGMDLATDENVAKGGGNSEILFYEEYDEDAVNYKYYGFYGMKGATGSAIVVDFAEEDFITIKYNNFKVNRLDDYDYKDVGETLTIDGTVTYVYTSNIPL